MSSIAKKLGKKIKLARVEVDMSQSDLAQVSNIDSSHIGKIERGEVNITVETLYRIAKALRCSPKILLPE
ncbi:helix-turn-helix transcriptional regulator [Colwellia sp. Arc7-D]|uniref:helix-turn-helix domain-containing protein n=1 Tax=Colwellia sp. Arc7-D TaxID=2161872 RepID=UPI000D342F1D|nr:helix-turn-helix transcriptional regulator [Colwellia sp. Arc7-D]AWB57444.1 transcriptional regulator [Colwellia sp. Arc7-D]